MYNWDSGGAACTTTEYTGDKLAMGAPPTFAVTAVRNIITGYTAVEKVCLSCTNGYDTEVHEFQVNQVALDCNTLSAATSQKTSHLNMVYNTATTSESAGSVTNWF